MAIASFTLEQLEDGTKHLFYKFLRIGSSADVITVKARGTTLMTFKQADFGESYANLVGSSYELDPLDCNDLSSIKIKGATDHTIEYTPEQNEIWMEYTCDKIGSNHIFTRDKPNGFSPDYEWWLTANTNFGRPIKLYKQGSKIATFNDLKNLLYYINADINNKLFNRRKFSSSFDNYLLDLSTVDTSKLIIPIADLGTNTNLSPSQNVCSYITLKDTLSNMNTLGEMKLNNGSNSCIYGYIQNKNTYYKYFDIPNTVEIYNCNLWFKDFTNLVETPHLPDSVVSMYSTFQGCSNLTTVKNIPENIVSLSYAFYGCSKLSNINCVIPASVKYLTYTFNNTSITDLPIFEDGVVKKVSNRTFNNCTKLTEIDINNFVNNSKVLINPFAGCTGLTKIKDFTIDLTKAGKRIDDLLYIIGNTNVEVGTIYIDGFVSCTKEQATEQAFAENANQDVQAGTIIYLQWNLKAIKHCKAMPYNLLGLNSSLPSSTGYDLWFDLVSDDKYNHTITQKTLPTKNIPLNTFKDYGEFTLDNLDIDLIEVSADYPYKFELVDIENFDYTFSITNLPSGISWSDTNNTGIKSLDIANGKLSSITLHSLKGLSENASITGKFIFNITYKANIDNYPFRGRTVVSLPIAINIIQSEYIEVTVSTDPTEEEE